jgi:pyruvate dehydrogenase E2 component (dihydrolipoamide acetyltransferase)
MSDITMPRLSDSMEQGTILTWLIEDGQPVAIGEELVEIETDKATMTHAAEAEGVLQVVAPAGTTLAVGELIARIGDGRSAAVEAAPAVDAAEANGSGGGVATIPAPAGTTTPLARRIAAVHGIDLAALVGSGPRGRITRADVLAAAGVQATPTRPVAAQAATVVAAAPAAPPRDPARGAVIEQEPSRLQQLIARRMVQATTTIPHFQVETEVEMDAAVALRATLKQAAEGDVVPSLNDLVVKAAAIALRRHPRANGSWRDDRFELHERVNVGVAVAADDALIVPTVFDADTKSLGQIARDVREVASRVRAGTVTPAELEGGTFTVSNLGMYGMSAITPVINAPQAAILGVGALRPVLTRVDGEIVDRMLMTLRLSCDHRILYGADAARFLAEVRDQLQQPLRMTLG